MYFTTSLSSTVPIMETDVRKLSDEELTIRLKALGEPVGPLTPTTRLLFERRLLRHLSGTSTTDNDAGPSPPPPPAQQPQTPPLHGCKTDSLAETAPLTPTGSSIRKDEIALSFTPPHTPSKNGAVADGTCNIMYYGVQVPCNLECVEGVEMASVLAFFLTARILVRLDTWGKEGIQMQLCQFLDTNYPNEATDTFVYFVCSCSFW